MEWNKKTIIGLSIGLLFIFSIFFFFSDLVVYTLIAFVISMIGRPVVKWMHIKLKCPYPLASITAIMLILAFMSGVIILVLPLFIRQGQVIMEVDYVKLTDNTYIGVSQLVSYLGDKGIHVSEYEIREYINNWLQQFIQKINIKNIVSNTANIVSTFFVALFCVLFIAFFFLKDEKLFKKILFLFIPDRFTEKVENILKSSELLLTRYFRGITIELICMMILLSAGLLAFGIDNALLFGCLGGLLNIIPYVGPVIGAATTAIFTIINYMDIGFTTEMFWAVIKVIGVFSVSNLIDNYVLQPFIFSNSIKAHPLEIFFVILMAGSLSGPGGMILAIPIYTVLRIIAKEFFRDTKIVHQLTKRI